MEKTQELNKILELKIRSERDARMMSVVNWYQRYGREERQGLPHVLTLEQIDNYAASLADVPQQEGFPSTVEWPVL